MGGFLLTCGQQSPPKHVCSLERTWTQSAKRNEGELAPKGLGFPLEGTCGFLFAF